jgi:hypothetical protein
VTVPARARVRVATRSVFTGISSKANPHTKNRLNRRREIAKIIFETIAARERSYIYYLFS